MNKKNILIIVLVLIVIILCGYIIYDKKDVNTNITDNKNETKQEKDKSNITYEYYENITYDYTTYDSNEKEAIYKKIYLLSDGTYWFVHGTNGNLEYDTGTYSNGKIIESGSYSEKNNCYYLDEYEYNYVIEDDVFTLNLEFDDMVVTSTMYKKENNEDISKIIKPFENNCSLVIH